jgi:NADPH:quinone reductase-like Zn-dependent oxidoreductase
MMKAIIQHQYGAPGAVLEVQDIATPVVKADEVLVRVRAASIHVGDWLLVNGVPYVLRMVTGLRKPKNRVPGCASQRTEYRERISRGRSRRSARM